MNLRYLSHGSWRRMEAHPDLVIAPTPLMASALLGVLVLHPFFAACAPSDGGPQGEDGGIVGLDGSLDSCGNAVVDPGEECDDGAESSTCDADCTLAECGDEHVNAARGEDCDALGETALCNADCTRADCGDGKLNSAAGEECDDGNELAGDGCSSLCRLEECGNGILDPGETCDEAGDALTCDGDCTPPECGDNYVNTAVGEECDDGGEFSGDGCSAECLVEICGNGRRDVGEICDDGAFTATCDLDCSRPWCGDGVVNAAAAEGCDTLTESATCDVDCTVPECGDGTVNEMALESCDDGATESGDGCDANCAWEGASGFLDVAIPCTSILDGEIAFVQVRIGVGLDPPPTDGGSFTVTSWARVTLPTELSNVLLGLNGGLAPELTLSDISLGLTVAGSTGTPAELTNELLPRSVNVDANEDGVGESIVVDAAGSPAARVQDGSPSVDVSLTSLHVVLDDPWDFGAFGFDVPVADPASLFECALPIPNPSLTFAVP